MIRLMGQLRVFPPEGLKELLKNRRWNYYCSSDFHQGQVEVTKDELKNGAMGEGNARRCESGKKKVYYDTWFEKE